MPPLTWAVALAAIAGVLARPRRIAEWAWAAGGAAVLVLLGSVRLGDAFAAVRSGAQVYLFLIGMMLLAEIARTQGVFDWLAAHALVAARGSQARLFALVYVACVVVTAFLSNDATAVVLTPAIATVALRAGIAPLPYLFTCAFVANAASFVLPISNPANLVVFLDRLPALGPWLAAFALPSFVAIVSTFAMLRFLGRRTLALGFREDLMAREPLSRAGTVAAWALGAGALGMLLANACGLALGTATFVLGCTALIAVGLAERTAPVAVARALTWQVVPLVAGLFVVVRALENAGALAAGHALLAYASTLPRDAGNLLVTAGVGALANLANNLPVALAAGASLHGGGSLHAAQVAPHIVSATAVAVDLSPNLSAGGSLATLLWLVTVRRSGVRMSALRFLRVGVLVGIPALVLAALVER